MLSRLVKCSYTVYSKYRPLWVGGAAFLIAIWSARASVSVGATSGGTSPQGTAYYAIQEPNVSPSGFPSPVDNVNVFMDNSDFNYFVQDPTIGFDADFNAGFNASTSTTLLTFNVTVNNTSLTTASQRYAFIVTIALPNGQAAYVPIAYFNGQICSQSVGCEYQAGFYPTGSNVNTVWYAADIPIGQQFSIGLYTRDICTYAQQNTGQIPTGCAQYTSTASIPSSDTTGYTTSAVPGTAQSFILTFDVISLPTSPPPPVGFPGGTFTATASDSATLTLNFQADGIQTSCTLPSSYFPGDSQILLNTGNFPINTTNIPTIAALHAPQDAVWVIGNDQNVAPVLSTPFNKSNAIATHVPFGATQPVTGFTNVTTVTPPDHSYDVAIMGRDDAGLIGFNSVCEIDGVSTTAILGFLNSSRCFIATGAFRSISSPPVQMLREFRDHVLSNGSVGRAFISWYYDWSPDAAVWLMRHPLFRFPVLFALIPIEIFAWICLHTTVLVILTIAAASIIGLSRIRFEFGDTRGE